jgi:hypothetical protein
MSHPIIGLLWLVKLNHLFAATTQPFKFGIPLTIPKIVHCCPGVIVILSKNNTMGKIRPLQKLGPTTRNCDSSQTRFDAKFLAHVQW